MIWVEGAVTWQWWVGTLLTIAIGACVGWRARGLVDRERQWEEWDDAQRAARVYQREIERARARHPSRQADHG